MAATVSAIKTRCPEFASTATATIELAIADTDLQLNRDAWGSANLADLAHVYLAAHTLKLWKQWETSGNASAGVVQSMRDGDLSKTFAISKGASDDLLSSTAYGREFIRLRGMAFASRVL